MVPVLQTAPDRRSAVVELSALCAIGELIVFRRDVEQILPQQGTSHSLGGIPGQLCSLSELLGGQIICIVIVSHNLST